MRRINQTEHGELISILQSLEKAPEAPLQRPIVIVIAVLSPKLFFSESYRILMQFTTSLVRTGWPASLPCRRSNPAQPFSSLARL